MRHLVIILAIGFAGCGGATVSSSMWTGQYCSEHRDDYHHSRLNCHETNNEIYCYYADEWQRNCRIVRTAR